MSGPAPIPSTPVGVEDPSTKAAYNAGLLAAHQIVSDLHDVVEADHKKLRGWFGVIPTWKHYALMASSQILKTAATAIFEARKI